MERKIAIVTDSNSGITQGQAKELGIRVVPNPFFIDGQLYLEDITLKREEFYEKLSEDAEISTSQPAPGDLIDTWESLLEEYDEIVHIPISSGLSSAYETAVMLSEDYNGKVQVVNNQRVSVMQRSSVFDALRLIEEGKNAKEIKEILEREKLNACAYITVDTLKYLKKGGRITPATATIGAVLNIKPVLTISSEKLDSIAKARGLKSAKKIILETVKKDLEEKYDEEDITLYIASSCDEETTKAWKEEVENYFSGREVRAEYLSLSVTCHTGPGALGIGYAKVVK